MNRRLLYATSNPGKIMEIRALMERFDLDLLAPQDVGLDLDVLEDGTTLEENARLKARGYLDALAAQGRTDLVVMADDTGLEIDALGGEPGIHVRRWAGYLMTDQEIIDLCLAKLARVPLDRRGAQFRTVIAIGLPDEPLALFDGTLRGVIQEQPDALRIEGFPFEALFFVPEWGVLLGRIHQLPAEQKAAFVTHREHAVRRALPAIRALLAG
ncbi:non-canonical purine NTP pyrophosphatase [Aggregatilinea lenta]|uniref:non-canonical purine NTP pyrophosphatase n=1 Tax=Aggregatilinea lenta TaxID=913108 RepID=UPI0013C2C17A|nr:non-canonical purine NTP pyrophosphatase [Aggregatilinea lenta]